MKAILILEEKPITCWGCPCHDYEFDVCQVYHVEMSFDIDNCPLKPLPQKAEVGEIRKVDDFMKTEIQQTLDGLSANIMLQTELLIATGYNLCVDEILGEEK